MAQRNFLFKLAIEIFLKYNNLFTGFCNGLKEIYLYNKRH